MQYSKQWKNLYAEFTVIKKNKINECRSAMFLKAYKSTNDKIFRQNVKSFDASALPPCQSELREHLLRTAYISKIWSNAHIKEPSTVSPLDCGWKVDENAKYDFNWFSDDQLPQSIDDVTFSKQNDKDSDIETLDESVEIFANDSCYE
ncbi:hypothetical protein NQ318_011462 [Aromia moschata]|uniref:Uncharacterized protein n=1 Tax=Aromia moschata TaxID=1265417 RepID=A0AAV8XZN4_9CUCU|nr:hypothetical protein NQ318_011462 [Aromia moschata]